MIYIFQTNSILFRYTPLTLHSKDDQADPSFHLLRRPFPGDRHKTWPAASLFVAIRRREHPATPL